MGVCVPQAGKVKTICSEDSISIEMNACLFTGTYNYDEAFVGDDELVNGCNPTVSPDEETIKITYGLQACNTIMTYDDESGNVVFKSKMNIPPTTIDGNISIYRPIEWTFQCTYDTRSDLTADTQMDATAVTDEFQGFGKFALSMSFYDNEFANELDSTSATHQVGKPVNFGITFNNGLQLSGLNFAPTSCEVVNTKDTSQVYSLFQNSLYQNQMMCTPEDHPVNFAVVKTPNESQFFGLSYTGFAFDSVTADVGQQLLKCHVEICNSEMLGTVCNSGCFEEPDEPGEGECKNQPTTYDWTLHPETAYYDNDWEKYYPEYYDHELDLNAGDTIRLSTLCTSKWISPYELGYGEEAGCDQYLGLTPYTNICAFENRDITPDHAERIFDSEVWITQKLNKLEDGSYITMLNCPQCGCTEGCYDAVTFDELKAIAQNGGENAGLERRMSQPPQKLSETRGRGSARGPQ
jgi:hypothetical protein